MNLYLYMLVLVSFFSLKFPDSFFWWMGMLLIILWSIFYYYISSKFMNEEDYKTVVMHELKKDKKEVKNED